MAIPVYAFTGFLDAGKTKFIQETLEDERFNAGERTLLLICEEGEEEYDLSAYPYQHVYPEVIDQEAVTTEELSQLFKKHHCERVVVELNGMLQVGPFYQKMPEDWQIAQEVMFADGTSILAYNANMRSLVVDKLTGCEMVVFNRLAPGTDIMPLHKLARALNRRVGILYEYTDGTTQPDEIEDPLPFDINAPVVEIGDDDFALWYRDITEEPKKYDGKTVRFKGQVARLKKDRDGYFAPGRFVMTCCVEDIAFMGLPCKYADAASLHAREWVTVEATVSVRFHALYRGTGPILTAIRVTPAEPRRTRSQRSESCPRIAKSCRSQPLRQDFFGSVFVRSCSHGRSEGRCGILNRLRNDVLRHVMQVRLQDAFHIRGVFLFRHAVDAEAARKIAADLPLHREIHIARDGHVAPRDTGGGQLQLEQLAVVRALHPAGEDLAQPGRHAPVDEIGRRRQRILRDIQVAQRLRALRDMELQPRLHGVQQQRRLIRREHLLRAGKL